eukprot:scaffold880_cov132-Cylindrotheca_fusiformis.AAC.2
MKPVLGAIIAVFIAFALGISSPEEPEYVKYEAGDDSEDTIQFVGGDGKTLLTSYWHKQLNGNASNGNSVPVILLCHGMGLVQGKSLSQFVEEFQQAGFAAVTFDYATFGKSDGFPRHQIHPKKQIADIKAAIRMIQKEGTARGVDVTKIALWGTSLGGGHVLIAAAGAHPAVRAVVAQVPHIASGLESVFGTLTSSPVDTTKGIVMFLLGLTKWAILKLGRRQAYFPIVGRPGSAAIMQNPGDSEGYLRLLNYKEEGQSGWKNAATTESALHILFYRPLNIVGSIGIPALLVAAESDTLCPAKQVAAAKERIPNSEILTLHGVGHFDVYQGDAFAEMLKQELVFFHKHLGIQDNDDKAGPYQEPTMPPRDSSVKSAGFVHIGKTGGSSISTLLRNGCTSFVAGPCRNISHETSVSKYVEHYYHVPDFWRLPETKHEAFIISIRDPFDRSVSSLLYHHPENAKVYSLRQTKKQLYYGPLAYACFPTLEAFAQLMHGNSTNCNYPYRQNSIVADDCTGLACAVVHGKVRLFSHLFFNYRNILDTKLPTDPPRRIFVLRQEFLWDDWKALNQLLGQTEPVIIPSASEKWRNVTGIKLPVTRDISLDGRNKLCHALQAEFMAYFRILKKAINMNKAEVEKSVIIAQKNCPNLDVRLMMNRS